jgi:F0F1-type ATP synthase delta subunit
MLSRIIAKKYAKALLGIGLNNGNYEALGQDLDKMADLLGESRDLRIVLRSPAFPRSARKTVARKVGERLGLATTTVKFIELLMHRKRMDHFSLIILPDKGVKILVAVADVDALVKKSSAIDEHARQNTTSVYTASGVWL